eukprot:640725-Amphidinium_carterae.1
MTPPTGVVEAHIRSELLTNKILPEDFINMMVGSKRGSTLSEILELLFQRYLPSEPTARVDALTQLETPLKTAKSFVEALRLLRAWKDQLVMAVRTLKARPDILRMFNTIQPLLSSLNHDTIFAVAHSNMLVVTNARINTTVDTLWRYIELLESELNDRALEEHQRNMRKPQAHLADQLYDAQGMEGKGKTKDGKNKKGKGDGKPKGGKAKPSYRNLDDNPKDTRPICPEFLKDSGCPTSVGKCLRCGAKGHSVAECTRPRRDNPLRPGGKLGGGRSGGRAGGRGGGRTNGRSKGRGRGNPRANNTEWLGETQDEGTQDQGEYSPNADYAHEEEEEYDEGTTWPDEGVEVPYEGSTAYLYPCIQSDPCDNPTAMISAPEAPSLTPILDTGASHCLLPVAHLTAEETELASRVHLRVANGALTRALMYQNIIYAKRVPRPLVSVGQVTQVLGLTFEWSSSTSRLLLNEGTHCYEVIRATLWNCLPCITDHELRTLVEALTTATLSTRVWRKADWEKGLGLELLRMVTPGTVSKDEKSVLAQDDPEETEGNLSTCLLTLEELGTDDVVMHTSQAVTKEPLPHPASGEPPSRTDAHASVAIRIATLEKLVLAHKLPKQPTRTNVVTEDQTPRSRLFGAYCTRGTGITLSTTRYPSIVQACLGIAETRSKRYPFASMQLTTHSYLPCHQDKNNVGCSWLIGLGTYTGGRLWHQTPTGAHPPPVTKHDWEKKLRGDYVDVNHTWHCFDGNLYHAVEP